MKKYIGTKQIEAEPMTMGEAALRGLIRHGIALSEADKQKGGYHVKYEDGYESWSPALPFEKAYKAAETPLDRMLIEYRELYDKMDKLAPFIESGKIDEVISDDYQKAMLKLQRITMRDYINILSARIGRMNGAPCAEMHQMDFGTAIHALREGYPIRRREWSEKGLFVIKQVPAHIESNIIPKMQSLPQSAKELILNGKGFIHYTSQCLIYNENTGVADSWAPSISDVFAEDWEIVTQNNNQ